jgi:error-prone DNA polymerase
MLLFARSYHSLRYGTLSVEELVASAARAGVRSLALTDINNSSGVPDFVKACLQHGIEPAAGIAFYRDNKHLYTILALNNEGFREVNEFLTGINLLGKELPEHPPLFSNALIIYPYTDCRPDTLREGEMAGITASQLSHLHSSPFRHHPSKLLLHHVISFGSKADFELHRHLRAINNNTLLSKLQPEQLGDPWELPIPIDRLRQRFENHPAILHNNEVLAEKCRISFEFGVVKNKKLFSASRYDDRLLLEKLAFDGLSYRYGPGNKEAEKRVRKELEVIDRLGFSAYFLITWDIIRYSMLRGFYHVGRGSGANSIVAYCLRITDVDPIELDLYFERFINPKRSSPPDFDIDYSWKDRDEVTDYIFRRYGIRHTALIGTNNTFRGKSILRELGKVYGLPKAEIDELVEHRKSASPRSHITDQIMKVGSRMVDYPNLRSIHAGGIIVSEEPLTCYTALDMPPKGYLTTQWDMYVAEELGFEKLDILSQRGIGHIKECVDIVKENQGISIDAHDVPRFKQDPQVRKQLMEGETNGCFYIESPAMRGLLKKLRCDNYISLVAASSIIRPGVAKSGMMKEYIQRFHNPGSFQYLHPVMEQQLKETYGVMVYQEDVIKVCHHFAGLDLADADVLRRAMSGKHRSRKEMDRIVEKFFSNCRSYGYPDELTREVWRQIESFAGYSFSKAHSASYAVESFQSLYLKAHYPLEFMVAVINNFGGFYQTWVYVNEARRCGATIEPPCVNHSRLHTCIRGSTVWLGFTHLLNIEHRLARSIQEERERRGEYGSLEDFVRRVNPAREQLVILIRVGALRFTGKSKKELLWQGHMLIDRTGEPRQAEVLIDTEPRSYRLPPLEHSQVEDMYDEIELLGFSVSQSSFALLKTAYRGELRARDLSSHIGRSVRMVGELVTIKYVQTVKGEMMHFAAFHDAEGEFFDTVHFPDSLKKYPFKGRGIYLILGKVVEEFGFPSIEVSKMAKLDLQPGL